MKRIPMLFCVAMMSMFLVGCNNDDPSKVDPSKPTNVKNNDVTGDVAGTINYGSKVFYFPHVGSNFGNALALFLRSHSELEVSAMAPHSQTAGFGETQHDPIFGHFVTFREKDRK